MDREKEIAHIHTEQYIKNTRFFLLARERRSPEDMYQHK